MDEEGNGYLKLKGSFNGVGEKQKHSAANPLVGYANLDHTPNNKPSHNDNHSNNAQNKKRPSRIIGGGLRQFSVIGLSVVADEIISDFAGTDNQTPESLDHFDEKNIRRRVYDALNVLMALDIITRDKKEIQWKGLPSIDIKGQQELKALRVKLVNRIGKKAAYLNDLKEQIAGFQHLISRNKQLLDRGSSPLEGFSLPFLLVQTSSHATVEIEISEDMQLVHFDFNSTPFSLHDDAYILKLLRRHQLPESGDISQSPSVVSSSSSGIASGGTKPFHWNSEAHTHR
ncbi:DP transcription factor [Parasponia andersonii]|uniref:DP transcription factor n=1 Tax=Parasponia andersonii TaxID=3476 RepID=A0A2P5APV8_PARAD|nr:DP transcription factor [Parasponia andersonii]